MDNGSTGAPSGNFLELLIRPAALLAGLVLAAAQLSRSYVMAAAVDRARHGGGYAMVSLAGMGCGIVIFVVFAIIHFMLSRKLGGPEDSEGEPGVGNWIAMMFSYFLASQLITFITPLMLSVSKTAVTSYPLVMGSISFVLRMVFFPVMVSLAALAHDGEGCSFGDIWSFLTSRGIVWVGGYVLLSLAVVFIPAGLMSALGKQPGVAMAGGMLLPSLVIAAGQLLTILYAIAAYRAARADKDDKRPLTF